MSWGTRFSTRELRSGTAMQSRSLQGWQGRAWQDKTNYAQHRPCVSHALQEPRRWEAAGLFCPLPRLPTTVACAMHGDDVPTREHQDLLQGSHDSALPQELLLLQPPAQAGATLSAMADRSLPGQLAPGTVLGGKFTVQSVLGTGGSSTTYEATGPEGQVVAVKALSLRAARDWKQLQLFEREAQTLAALSHPGIPEYLDYFEEDTPTDRAFYLVQEAVAGKSLALLMKEGARCSSDEAVRIAIELCEVLAYLSSLNPPVVHRDVKPENVVIAGSKFGGRVYLVDFGGVGAAAAASSGDFATTVVGTYGYMAPEQFRGAAASLSDMYGLGGTLLALLSGRPPSAFPQEGMRTAWQGAFTPPSKRWGVLLESLLEPLPEDRLTARQALELLRGGPLPGARRQQDTDRFQEALAAPMTPQQADWQTAVQLSRPRIARKPAGSRVMLERSVNRLDITIPPKGLLNADTLATGSFAVVWNAFVAVWTFSALAGGGFLFALFSLPFWFAGVQLGKQAFGSALMKERFAIGRTRFRLGQELALLSKEGAADFLGGDREKVAEGLTEDLRGARLITTMFVNNEPQTAIEVIEGVRKYRLGEGLTTEEQAWLVTEINSHIEQMQGEPVDFAALPPMDMPRRVDNNTSSAEP